MKLLSVALCVTMLSAGAQAADNRLLPNARIADFTDLAGASVADGDFMLMYDTSADAWLKTSLEGYSEMVGALNGLTATVTELNYLDITTLGTGAASKAVVLDAGDDYTWPAAGILSYGVLKDSAGTTLGATAAELNLAADISANFEDVTAANVLTTAECGKVTDLNSGTEFASTLPTPTSGCKFGFIVKAAPSGASYTVVTTGADIIYGVSTAINGGATGQAEDTITFVDGQAVIGDRVDVVSDGTNWYAIGLSSSAAGITFSSAI